jgi:U3 small nucleolar RNA-associated protein 22
VAKLARCLPSIDLMVQLEGSGKWPDHPEAYNKMKAALGCQLAQALEAGAGARCGGGQYPRAAP